METNHIEENASLRIQCSYSESTDRYGDYRCSATECYGEHEGKVYCILHFPSTSKSDAFRAVVQSKIENEDFEFRGAWFPDRQVFEGFNFNNPVNFCFAVFSQGATFLNATFQNHANFSYSSFLKDAMFKNSSYKEEADFRGITFTESAIFEKAVFNKRTEFSTTSFHQWAYFLAASFADVIFWGCDFLGPSTFYESNSNGVMSFEKSTFTQMVMFKKATFMKEVYFTWTEFKSYAFFDQTSFMGKVDFHESTFSEVKFTWAVFNEEALFQGVTFSAEASFYKAIFNEKADFRKCAFTFADYSGAKFKDYLMFSSKGVATSVSEISLCFHSTTIEKPDRVSFEEMKLQPHWFIYLDVRKFSFVDVSWSIHSISEELELASKEIFHIIWIFKPASPHTLLAKTCREIALNSEDNHRYEEASRFRFLSMDIQRKAEWKGYAIYKLHWWYWAASGYGEKAGRAFFFLLAILLLFAISYTKVGFHNSTFDQSNTIDNTSQLQNNYYRHLTHQEALVYSFEVITLQKPNPRPLTLAARLLVTMEIVLGPLQIALLALAIRRKFMR